MTTRVGSCNLRFTLSDAEFEKGLREVLSDRPHLLALQESGKSRDHTIQQVAKDLGYEWARPKSPNGDPTMPVMWSGRYRLRSCKAIRLARREYVGHLPGRKDWLPASWATEVLLDDLAHGGVTVLIGFHLTADVQAGAGYDTNPKHALRVMRHRRERHRLGRRARMQKRRGRTVYVAGDSNYSGFHIGRFVSCWEGRNGATLGNRAVDVVLAETRAVRLWTVETPSDHDAVVCVYP